MPSGYAGGPTWVVGVCHLCCQLSSSPESCVQTSTRNVPFPESVDCAVRTWVSTRGEPKNVCSVRHTLSKRSGWGGGSPLLRRAWYAVAKLEDVSSNLHPVTVHGENILIYRTAQGQVRAVGRNCPHRGCDLSLGAVTGEVLVCPFHGWQFDAEGQCVHIPANQHGQRIPKRARLRTFPVTVRGGLVWVCTGGNLNAASLPPLDIQEELDHPNFHKRVFSLVWNAHFIRSVESSLDVSHLPFVHPDTTGRDVSPVVQGPEYHVEGNRLRIHPRPFAPAHPMEPPRPTDAESDERVHIELRFPNHWMIRAPVAGDAMMCTYVTYTPIDDAHTLIFGVVMRNFADDSEFLDSHHLEHTLRVLGEDQRIIESIRPLVAPFDLHMEAHVPSDGPTVRYRKMLRDACNKERLEGWV